MNPVDSFNSAVELRLQYHLDECREACERLWRSGFQNEYIALLRGNLQLDLGNYDDSLYWYTTAWSMVAPGNRVKPDVVNRLPDFALPYAYARLRAGLWDAFSWQLWEIGRLGRSWNPAPGTRPWDGSLEKMIVLSEGGYGDAFLFSRLFQKLEPMQRAASRFVLGPQFAGLKGFRQEWDGMAVVNPDEEFNWQSFKFSTALMSLMAVMQVRSPADIPAAEKMIVPPDGGRFSIGALASLCSGASNRTDKQGPRLGLCWSAEENGVQKRIRSIDNVSDLEPLSRWSFVNFNPGKTLLSAPTVPRLFEADLKSWTDTARVIAGLDCVVSVDTAVLHLAGLLGVPAIGIIPLNSDWKFLLGRDDCFWWKSVTLVRNTVPLYLPTSAGARGGACWKKL